MIKKNICDNQNDLSTGDMWQSPICGFTVGSLWERKESAYTYIRTYTHHYIHAVCPLKARSTVPSRLFLLCWIMHNCGSMATHLAVTVIRIKAFLQEMASGWVWTDTSTWYGWYVHTGAHVTVMKADWIYVIWCCMFIWRCIKHMVPCVWLG